MIQGDHLHVCEVCVRSLALSFNSSLLYSSFQRALLYSSLQTLIALVSLGSQFCLLSSKRLQVPCRYPFPELQPGNSLQIVKGAIIWFLTLRDHYPSLSEIQCLTIHCFIYVYELSFSVVSNRRVNLVPVTPFWPKPGDYSLATTDLLIKSMHSRAWPPRFPSSSAT